MDNPSGTNELQRALCDIITGEPTSLRIGRKTVRLYPQTFAKTLFLSRLTSCLDSDAAVLHASPYVECLRLAETQAGLVSEILAVHSCPNTRKDFYNRRGMVERRNLFMQLERAHLAGLLLTVLTCDRTDYVAEGLGISAERRRLDDVLRRRGGDGSSNTVMFGGKSVFGSFIGPLKEMGYRDDEILFELSYSYLRLMLMDKVTSLYLSDDELECLPQEMGGRLLDGDSDGDLDALAGMIKAGGGSGGGG